MWPILFEIPGTPIKIFGFGTLMVLALWTALTMASRRARREGLDPDMVGDISFWVIVSGLIGARIVYVLEYWGEEEMHSIWDILAVWKGGIVLYGSILGGLLGFLLYRYLRPFPILATLDVIAPALAAGIALGRVGCFLNGCCYGDVCSLPWAVRFPKNSLPWKEEVGRHMLDPAATQSLALHPTQLYSALDGLILVVVLATFYPLRRRDGQVMALLMLLYPISRILIEWLRDDESFFVGSMTIAQAVSVGIFAGGLLFWWLVARRKQPLYASQPPIIPSASGTLPAAG